MAVSEPDPLLRSRPEITVAAFNLHRGVDRRGRPFDVVAACAALDADVLGLEEAWRDEDGASLATEIGSALGYAVHEGPIVPHGREPDGRPVPWRVALLSRRPMRPLPDLPVPNPARWCSERPAARVAVDVGGTEVVVACVHLCHRPQASYRQLRRVAASLAADPPDVIVGDFNLWATGVRLALPGWERAVSGRTWPASFPHSQIDHILVGGRLAVVEGAVRPKWGSDHLPVWARLRLARHRDA